MSSLDAVQVTLTLTNEKFVLNELRKKRRLVLDPNTNEEVFKIQFDSKTFEFKKDRQITVGKTIADCLCQDAFVIVGAAIDGSVEPVLRVVKEFNLSDGEAAATPTTCLYCKEDQGTVRNLAAHLIDSHSDEDEDDAAAPSHAPARSARKAPKEAKDGDDADSN